MIFRYRHFRLKEMEQEGGVTWANTSVSKRLRVMVGVCFYLFRSVRGAVC